MAIDTLAYTKALEEAAVERRIAEAHAEAMARFALPDLATKADIQRREGKWTVPMWAVRVNVALTVAVMGVLLRAAGHG